MSLALVLNPPTNVQFRDRLADGSVKQLFMPAYLTLDASITETHAFSNTITNHPVQTSNGNFQDVSDNVQFNPVALSIDGIVSDSPIRYLSGLTLDASSFTLLTGKLSPSLLAYEAMLTLMKTGLPFDVITSRKLFPSMQIENLDVPVNAAVGKSFQFSAKLREITLIEYGMGTTDLDIAAFPYTLGMVLSSPPSADLIIAAALFVGQIGISYLD